MSLIKRGTISSKITVASSIYSCGKCGHTEIIRRASKRNKKCPNCKEEMAIIETTDGVVG